MYKYTNVVFTCAALAVLAVPAFAQVTIPEVVDFQALFDAAFAYLGQVIAYVMTFLVSITVAWKAYSYFARA